MAFSVVMARKLVKQFAGRYYVMDIGVKDYGFS